MNKKAIYFFILLLILSTGCTQADTSQSEPEVKKKVVPIPYPEEAKATQNPIAATEENLAIGKQKYETFCTMCHGFKGEGGEEATKGFEVDPSNLISNSVKQRSDGELFWATSNGVNDTNMLPWSELLSDEEIWYIVNYIRVLQK
jgi:mono/diheme cytochrome c family protein